MIKALAAWLKAGLALLLATSAASAQHHRAVRSRGQRGRAGTRGSTASYNLAQAAIHSGKQAGH
jgi:hypothetical protein